MPALTESRVRRAAIAWAVILVAVLAFLSAAVDQRTLEFTDRLILLVAQAPAGPLLDWVMAAISETASVEVTTVAMVALVLLTRSRQPLGWQRLVPLVVFGGVVLLELLGKDLVHQPPPPADLVRGPHLPGLGMATAGAYPSGHMVRVTLLLGLVTLRLARRSGRQWWLWVCIAAVWTVGYSRVYLAHHWPADVAGGILLGGLGLALCLALAPRASIGDLDPDPSG